MKRSSARRFAVPGRVVAAIGTLISLAPAAGLAATPAFLAAAYFNSGAVGTESAVVADVNLDGNPDLIVAIQNQPFGGGRNGLAAVLLGNGDGTFGAPVTYDSAGGAPFSLAVADLNGDGAPDIVVDNFCVWIDGACSFTTVGVLINHGDGTFAPAVPWNLGGSSSQSIAIASLWLLHSPPGGRPISRWSSDYRLGSRAHSSALRDANGARLRRILVCTVLGGLWGAKPDDGTPNPIASCG